MKREENCFKGQLRGTEENKKAHTARLSDYHSSVRAPPPSSHWLFLSLIPDARPSFPSPPLSFSTDYLFIAGCTASSQLLAKEPVFPSYTDPSFKAELFPGKLRHCSRGPHCASLKVTTNPLTRGEV
ncbi:hypothetical protein ILYODFUR_020349 [Ilyodon furcidens]|uniref:Uncharacterized protein n=1 Tax=Ilyodon furcidens TaxID=33524 RepID=A0ABV0UHN6_9TELE